VTASVCADVAARLSAWIDGELDASTAAAVQDHLAACVSCRRRHSLLVAASRAVRSLPEETVPAGFEEAFRRRLATARTGAGRPRGRSPVLVAAAALAAVLMLVVLKPLALRRTSPPVTAPTERTIGIPRWLATCGAPTARDCQRDTPCASAETCGVVSVVSTASAGSFSQTSPPAFATPR